MPVGDCEKCVGETRIHPRVLASLCCCCPGVPPSRRCLAQPARFQCAVHRSGGTVHSAERASAEQSQPWRTSTIRVSEQRHWGAGGVAAAQCSQLSIERLVSPCTLASLLLSPLQFVSWAKAASAACIWSVDDEMPSSSCSRTCRSKTCRTRRSRSHTHAASSERARSTAQAGEDESTV